MALERRYYLAPYEEVVTGPRAIRRVIVDQLTSTIESDGGSWTEGECNGTEATGAGWALVKLIAEPATHTLVAALPGVKAIPPGVNKDTSLGDLTPAQRTGLKNWLNDLGYPDGEIQAKLPADWTTITLGQVFRFLLNNNALAVRSGGSWYFGRFPRKTLDVLEQEVTDPPPE